MKLAWKAAALILINVVITFAAGLLARNFILNPELAQVERSNDEKILRQLNLIQELVVASLVDSVNRARQTASGIREDHWQQYSVAISSLAANSDYDFVISASRNGDLLRSAPGAPLIAARRRPPKKWNRSLPAPAQPTAIPT